MLILQLNGDMRNFAPGVVEKVNIESNKLTKIGINFNSSKSLTPAAGQSIRPGDVYPFVRNSKMLSARAETLF